MARTSLIRPSTKNALRTRTGMVFQRPTPFPVTIRDNITGGVKLHERLIKSVMDEWAEGPLARAALRGEIKGRLKSSLQDHRAACSSGSALQGDPIRRMDQRA
jgi:ABC-type phosphate transport system ATPase subunit